MHTVRIWDLPTRLFHWALAACVVALVITAKVGGDAMNWHMRLGYAVLALLLFRLVWGLVGGYWSRFVQFAPTPARLGRHFSGRASAHDQAGHNAVGALSVLAMLLVLGLQVGSGLFTNDEIAFAGPLTALVSGRVVSLLTTYHKSMGQALVIGLVVLHVLAIVVYRLRGKNLVGPMLSGDKQLAEAVPPARDGGLQRGLALIVLVAAAALVYAVVQLGAPG